MNAAAAAHHPPGGNRRIDAARQQADHASAYAGSGAHPPRGPCRRSRTPRSSSASTWIVSRGLLEVHPPAARFLDPAAHFALDLRRRQRKALVGAPGRHAEGLRLHVSEVAQDLAGDGLDVERRPAGAREVRDAEDTPRAARESPSTQRSVRARSRSAPSAPAPAHVEIRAAPRGGCEPGGPRTTAGSCP